MLSEEESGMKKTIGLFGCMVNNDNLGCCALTYSLLNLIEQQSKKHNVENKYIIFERNPDNDKVKKLAETLTIAQNRVVSEKSARFIRLYKKKENDVCKSRIAECDLIIDLTQGDSFTDIYGFNRFISYTLDKVTVEKLGVSLVLGPQTYGPYRKPLTKFIAKKTIQKADYVFSRDLLSKTYLDDMKVNKDVYVGTDLAIGLPYTKENKLSKSVGINISGLLWPDKVEETETKFSLKCDYREFMIKTVQLFIDRGYSVYFISHVGADYQACCEMKKIFPMATLMNPFETPVEAKSFISRVEVFIGARMHATIAALSSGVPVIPIAYSRKFKGLFENCQYDIGVDLTKQDLNDSVMRMEKYADNVKKLKEKVEQSRKIAYERYMAMADRLGDVIFLER